MSILDEILSRIDPLDIYSEYLDLKKAGKEYKALCPFHADKNPSFYVNPETGLYHCFGCQASGNIVRFIMEMEKVDYKEALQILAKKAGISLKEFRPANQRELQILSEFANYLHNILIKTQNPALKYLLKQRKLTYTQIVTFKLGYYPEHGFRNFVRKFNLSYDLGISLKLVKQTSNGFYEIFKNRLIFPIFSSTGKVIAIGGRALDSSQKPKYINLADTPFFKKGKVLYGFYQARKEIRTKREVYIVEGYMDVIAMYGLGFINTVASLGTAFTPEHAKLLGKIVDKAYLIFDSDEAGRRARERTIPILLAQNIIPYVVELEGIKDPAEAFEKGQKEIVEQAVENSKDFMDYFLSDELEGVEQAKQIKKVKELVNLIPDEVVRNVYLKKLEEITGIKLSLRRRIVRQKRNFPKILPREIKLLIASAMVPQVLEYVIKNFKPEYFETEQGKALFKAFKEGRSLQELLAILPQEEVKPYIEFMETLHLSSFDFKDRMLKEIKRFEIERKFANNEISFEEFLELKRREVIKNERLDNKQ